MRVSTIGFQRSSLASLTSLRSELEKYNQQLATGSKIQRVSDDPVASAQIQRIENQINVVTTYNKNADAIERHLVSEDGLLDSYNNVLIRLKELAVQAGNVETQNSNDRRAMASEIRQRLQEVTGIANTKNSQGEYVFSGYAVEKQPYVIDASGRYTYQGDQGQRFVRIGSNTQVATSDPGTSIFSGLTAPAGSHHIEVSNSNTGSLTASVGQVSDVTAWQASVASNETYTLTFNPLPGSTFDIVADSNPGVPLAGFDDVVYTSGMTVSVAGIDFTLSGASQPGDVVTLGTSPKIDIFTSLERFSSMLESSPNNEAVHYETDNILATLDNAINKANLVRSQIGARLNSVDSQRIANSDLELASKTTLANLKDIDFAEVISNISQLTTSLQASQQSFINISRLSLFDYLR